MELFALSVRQPWAHHIIFDGKDIENRKWSTKFRGRLLIQAAMKPDPDKEDAVTPEMKFECGHVIGYVDVVDVVEESDSPWFLGPYGLVLENPTPIIYPEPCRGRLGIFPIHDEWLIERLRRHGIK